MQRHREYTPEDIECLTIAYRKKTDEELLDIIRQATKELGRPPNRADIPASRAFKSRFGPWPRVLEAAGVKEVSPVYQRRVATRKAKHRAKRQREWEIKKAKRQEKNGINGNEEEAKDI